MDATLDHGAPSAAEGLSIRRKKAPSFEHVQGSPIHWGASFSWFRNII